MPAHFLTLATTRAFNLREASKLTEEESHQIFQELRWESTETQVCPACNRRERHYYVRTRRQWSCRHIDCAHRFSVTSGTVLAYRKLSFKDLILCMVSYVTSRKSVSALEFSSKFGFTPQTSWRMLKTLRLVLWDTRDLRPLVGAIETDGGHCHLYTRGPNFHGGYVSPHRQHLDHLRAGRLDEDGNPPEANRRDLRPPAVIQRRQDAQRIEQRVDDGIHQDETGGRRRALSRAAQRRYNQNRRVVMVMRQRDQNGGVGADRTIVEVCKTENYRDTSAMVNRYVELGSTLISDGAQFFHRFGQEGWDQKMVVHGELYSDQEGGHTNNAESFFARLRRCTKGAYMHHDPKNLPFYANEVAWREDTRRLTTRQLMEDLLRRMLSITRVDLNRYRLQRQRLLGNDGLFDAAA